MIPVMYIRYYQSSLHRINRYSLLCCLCCITGLLAGSNGNAQTNSAQWVVQHFDQYRRQHLQEKIFVHTDRDTYLAGDICWFRIYNVDGAFHQPLLLGKLAYVELLDQNNQPVLQSKINLSEDDAHGSLFMPYNLATGNYTMRAYTNWMKNAGPAFFFEKTIVVINAIKNLEVSSTLPEKKYTLRLFPEGGNMVNGLAGKIAFTLRDQYGKGGTGRGVVLNSNNDTLVRFQTGLFGIGNFLFTPKEGEQYRAIVKLSAGSIITAALPVTYHTGYTMQVTPEGNRLKLTVRTSPGMAEAGPVHLFAHTRGSVKLTESKLLSNGLAEFTINKSSLGEGISHLTLFNNNKQPLCERLVFKYPEQPLQLQLGVAKKDWETREKVTVQIAAQCGNATPAATSMSMAVYRADSLQWQNETDINSYLLLSADLQGNIESPGYYFNKVDNNTELAMDNLLLTHGWRRFSWQEVLQQQPPPVQYVPEFAGHTIHGKVVDKITRRPGIQIPVYLSVPGTRSLIYTSISDTAGRIKFELSNFYNEREIIVQTNALVDSTYAIEIANPFSGSPANSQVPALLPFKVNEPLLQQHHTAVQVQQGFHLEKFRQYAVPSYDTSAFYTKPDASYLLDNYVRFTTMEEVFREYIMAVNVRKRGGNFSLPVLDITRNEFFLTEPLVMLDGVPVFDFNKLMQYDPLKVWKLDVLLRKYYLSNNFFDGIVNLITYKGDLPGFELPSNALVLDYEGLQSQRIFYSPEYTTTESRLSRLPDFRNLLFWAPHLNAAHGKATASFYTADLPGNYIAVVQALSADGKAASNFIPFTVHKGKVVAGR